MITALVAWHAVASASLALPLLQDTTTPPAADPPTAPAAQAEGGEAEEIKTIRLRGAPRELAPEIPADIKAILQSSWDAVGGPAPLHKYKSLQFSMTVMGAANFSVAVRFGPNGQFALRQTMPGMQGTIEKGWNGSIAWVRDPREGGGAYRLASRQEVLRHAILFDSPDVFSRVIAAGGLAWEIRETEVFAGRPVHVIRIWGTRGDWSELLIGQQDKIPVAARYYSAALDRINKTTTWTDLTRVGGADGYLLPLRSVTQTDDGQNDMAFAEVEVNTLSPAHFEPPAEVRDLAARAAAAASAAKPSKAAESAPPSTPPAPPAPPAPPPAPAPTP